MNVTIERATEADLDAVHDIESRSFPQPWRREFFASELEGPGRLCLVARAGGNVAGYLFAMWLFDEMHINKIAVEESMRRQGIALALMNFALSFARGKGVETLSLEVRESNAEAQGFYRFLDFTAAYKRPRYYPDGEAALVMTKRLS